MTLQCSSTNDTQQTIGFLAFYLYNVRYIARTVCAVNYVTLFSV